MSLDITSKEKPVRNFLSSLLEAYPDATMRDIAVLFTDVVGSTTFFKIHGDIRGREMLRTHHRMAVAIVEAYGGRLIKEVGDSVLVYFPNTVDALNAAIKIQQKFLFHNIESIEEDQIHVRVGLHHGRVIMEDKDIYGDVVNVAAKLTNLAGADQIFVSHEIYEATNHLPSVQFESIDFWKMEKVPDGLKIYKVIWEHAFAAAPSKKIFAITVPDPAQADFKSAEDDIIASGTESPNRYLSLSRIPGNGFVAAYGSIQAAVNASKNLLCHLSRRYPPDRGPLPVKIYVRCASLQDEKTVMSRGAGNELDNVAYGGIYATPEVYHYMTNYYRMSGESPLVFKQTGNIYTILDEAEQADDFPLDAQPGAEASVGAPVGHSGMVCFYCGSNHHPASMCPSKTLPETERSLHKLGYLSVHDIEEVARSIQKPFEDIKLSPPAASAGSRLTKQELVARALYDIRSVYQLRFHQVVWNTTASTWETMMSGIVENQGGFAWLAQDSLRVANYEKAKSFLNLALERRPQDYKAWCVSGFLNIEERNVQQAVSDFKKALECAQADIPRTYVSLVLARLHKLTGDQKRTGEMIGTVLVNDPSCREALYEDVILRFSQDAEGTAIKRLVELVRDNRDYFVIALIDPELNAWRNLIYPHLFEMLLQVKNEAEVHFEDAKKEIARIRSLLPRETLETIDPLLIEIGRLVQSESYSACLDVPSKCNSVRILCKNALNEQISTVTDIIRTLRSRSRTVDDFLASYRYPHFVQKRKRQLESLKASLLGIGDVRVFESSAEFQQCYDMCEDISGQLSSLESSMEYLEMIDQLSSMCWKFLKHSSIFLSIVFVLGVFVFPLISDQLNFVAARLDIPLFPNSWSLQKSLLVFGGILSLIMSFLISVKEALKEKE